MSELIVICVTIIIVALIIAAAWHDVASKRVEKRTVFDQRPER